MTGMVIDRDRIKSHRPDPAGCRERRRWQRICTSTAVGHSSDRRRCRWQTQSVLAVTGKFRLRVSVGDRLQVPRYGERWRDDGDGTR